MMDWLRWDGWPTDGEWQAFWAFSTTVIALVAAVIALRQYRTSVENQVEQARPMVVVDFRFLGALYACVDVTNAGQTAARDVSFKWSTRPIAMDESSQRALNRALVDGTIPFLAPGRTISYFLNKYDDGETESNLPRRFEVRATYRGPAGHRTWDSESVLDVDQWAETLVQEDPYNNITSELKKIVAASANQKTTQDLLAKAADSLNVYLEAGPRVQMARQKERAEWEARREQMRERRSQRYAAPSPAEGDGDNGSARP